MRSSAAVGLIRFFRKMVLRRIGKGKGAESPDPLRTFIAFSAMGKSFGGDAGKGQRKGKIAASLQHLFLGELIERRHDRQRGAQPFRKSNLQRSEEKWGAVGKRISLEDAGGDHLDPLQSGIDGGLRKEDDIPARKVDGAVFAV